MLDESRRTGVTVVPGAVDAASQDLLTEVRGLLVQVTGEDERWAARITPASRLEGDLRLESVELTELGVLLRRAHGDRVDLAEFYAGQDIDQIIGLTVGDLVGYVARCLDPGPVSD
jgi:acyl carrier protein